jgi:hypothetical protein
MKISTVLACASLALSGCGGDVSLSSSVLTAASPALKVINIEGDDADLLINVLFQSGLRDASGRLGALHLKADAIICSAAVVPDPRPSCSIMVQGDMKSVATGPAATMFQVLKAHGVKDSQDTLGIEVVGGGAVDCQRVTIHTGISKCSLTIHD